MSIGTESFETPRDFERMLRDAGFSRSRAKAITAKGFRAAGLEHQEKTPELDDVLESLAIKKNRLMGDIERPCRCGCTGETKQRSEDSHERCMSLRREIRGANTSRWKARKDLHDYTKVFEAAARRFSRRFDGEQGLSFSLDFANLARSMVGLIRRASPSGWPSTAADVVSIIRKLKNYNGNFAREYERFARPYLSRIDRLRGTVDHLEDNFRGLVDDYKQSCRGPLASSDFNRPSDLSY